MLQHQSYVLWTSRILVEIPYLKPSLGGMFWRQALEIAFAVPWNIDFSLVLMNLPNFSLDLEGCVEH